MLSLLLGLQACAPLERRAAGGLESPERHYDVSLQAAFSTRGEDGPEIALAPQRLSLRGHVVMIDATTYPDGSVGTIVLFEDFVDLETQMAHGLSGRALEIRNFEDGEVLEIHGLSHLSGTGRHGDSLDILIALLSPKAPGLQPLKTVGTTTSYPIKIGDGRGHKLEVVALWSAGNGGPFRAPELSYQGQLRCSGRDGALGLACAGAVQGTISLDPDGELLKHTMEWTRTVVLKGPGGALIQEQEFQASAVRIQVGEP
jgi:hypothetical protein